MARFSTSEGRARIHILTALSSMSAPSLAQIQAGVDASAFLVKDGFSAPRQGNEIPASTAMERENLSIAGSISTGPVTMTFHRDDTADTPFNTLVEGNTFYVVFSRKGGSGASGALAIGDVVEVYHGDVLDRSPADIGENTLARVTVRLSTRTAPDVDAVVAA